MVDELTNRNPTSLKLTYQLNVSACNPDGWMSASPESATSVPRCCHCQPGIMPGWYPEGTIATGTGGHHGGRLCILHACGTSELVRGILYCEFTDKDILSTPSSCPINMSVTSKESNLQLDRQRHRPDAEIWTSSAKSSTLWL